MLAPLVLLAGARGGRWATSAPRCPACTGMHGALPPARRSALAARRWRLAGLGLVVLDVTARRSAGRRCGRRSRRWAASRASGSVDRRSLWRTARCCSGLASGVGWFDRYVVDGVMNVHRATARWSPAARCALQTGRVARLRATRSSSARSCSAPLRRVLETDRWHRSARCSPSSWPRRSWPRCCSCSSTPRRGSPSAWSRSSARLSRSAAACTSRAVRHGPGAACSSPSATRWCRPAASTCVAVDGWGVSLLLAHRHHHLRRRVRVWTVKHRGQEFYVLLLVLVAGVFGVFVALDLFVFFLFYEIAVLPMYLLIGIWGSSRGKCRGRGRSRFAWKRFDIGGARIRGDEADADAAGRLGVHPRRHPRPVLRGRRAARSTWACSAATKYPLATAAVGVPASSGSASASWPASSRSTPGRPTATPRRPPRCRCCTPAC